MNFQDVICFSNSPLEIMLDREGRRPIDGTKKIVIPKWSSRNITYYMFFLQVLDDNFI